MMKSKRKILKVMIAVAVTVTMLLGILQLTAENVFAADVSYVKEASKTTLLTRDDLAKLGDGKIYKSENGYQYADFQGKKWFVAGGTNSAFTGNKDGLVLWSADYFAFDIFGPVGNVLDGFTWNNSLLYRRLNSDDEQYWTFYNVNKIFTKAAKNYLIPVTVEDWTRNKKSYNNYLYIPDRNDAGNGIFIGPQVNELEVTFDEYKKISKKYPYAWLRSVPGFNGKIYYIMEDVSNGCLYYKTISRFVDDIAFPIYPSCVMDLTKTLLATTSQDASSLSEGKHTLSSGTMSFRFLNDEKIKSTIEYTDDNLCIKKDYSDGDIYLCVQYATWGSSNNEEIYTKKISGDAIIDAFDLGINTFKYCKVWLEKKDTTDNLIYAKEGAYYQTPSLTYTSYGVTEEFTPGVASRKAFGKVSFGGFAPSFNPTFTVDITTQSGEPASTSLWAEVDDGELFVSTTDVTGPGSYYLQIKVSDGTNTKVSEKIPVTIGKLDHAKNEKSLSVAAESEETYSTTLFWPAEGGSYGTPTVEGTIQATNISIDATGSDKTITFTVPSCKDESTGKIIIPVTGCKLYKDYNIVINLAAYGKKVTYWSKDDLAELGRGSTYYVKTGVLQKAYFAGKEWYAIGAEKNANTNGKTGLVLLSASSICDRVYNTGYTADYVTSALNNALNSSDDTYKSEACNINKLFTDDERALILKVNVDYALESTSKIANNVQLYVPDGNSNTSLFRDTILLGTSNTFKLLIKDWKGADSGYFWCRSRVNSDGQVYVANVYTDWKCLSDSYVNEARRVVPQLDLDVSKVLFASTAPAVTSQGTADVTPNDTMVFRFDGAEKIKSTLAAGEKDQTYEITKSADDKQPVYFCAQYNTLAGKKIFTQLIAENTTVDLSSIFAISSDVTIWIETTSADGQMVYAKKVQPAITYKAIEPRQTLYANTENVVTLGSVEVKGYAESDIILTAAVFESDAKDATEITDGTISAYIDDGKLCVRTTTEVKVGTYCAKAIASSQYFSDPVIMNDTVSVVKRDYSPAVLSLSVGEGTGEQTIADYTPNGGGTLGTAVTSGELNITNVTSVKKYSTYNISFTVTDGKAGQTGRIEIPVSNCKNSNDYKLVISVTCAGSALTWYSQDTLKSLGSNTVFYKGTNSLLKANFAGRTWAVVGAENNINTGNKDTLVMVSTGSVATSEFNGSDESAKYEGSKVYQLLNSSNSAFANLDGNAHKIFGEAIKYVVPVTVNYADDNGGMATALDNYLYLIDGDTNISSINMGTTGSYSMPLDTFKNNVNVSYGNQSYCWLRSAAKLNYIKSIVNSWRTYMGERFMMTEDGHVIPEFNLDLQNVLFASPAVVAQEGTSQVDSNNDLVFRFRDADIFDGKVYYSGTGTAVNVVLSRTYSDSVYLCVQYEEDGIEKLYSALVTASGTIDLKDNVKGDLSKAHIWLEMKEQVSGIVYAMLCEENAHEHSWQYGVSEDGKTLEAWCGLGDGGNCEYGKNNKVSLTLEAENNAYTSTTYEVMISGTEGWTKAGLAIPTIFYEGVDGTTYAKTEQPPYGVGTYKATISAGEATASVQFAISKRAISVTGTSVENKVYDKSSVATVNVGRVEGIIDGDDVKLGATGAFAGNESDVNAGDNKTVKVEYTLIGEDAANYEVPKAEYYTANITQKTIFVTAKSVSSVKGETMAALTYTADKLADGDLFSGVLATDADMATAGSYEITQGNLSAGSNYLIIFTSGNYTVTEKQTRTISFEDTVEEPEMPLLFAAAPLLAEAPLMAESVTPPEIVNGNITITYGDLTEYTQPIKETDIPVTYSSSVESVATVDENGKVTIVGAGTTVIKAVAAATGEYEQAEATYTLTVLKQPVNVPEAETGLVYDGTEQAGVTADGGAIYSKTGYLGTDAGEYTCTLTLAEKGNYIWNTPAPTTEDRAIKWNIAKKRLTVTGSTADKEYDGSALANVTVGDVTGIIEKAGVKEDVKVTAKGVFDRPNAADEKKVWVDYSISGEDQDNYLAPVSELIDAKITPKKLSISGTTVADKVYDGTRSAVATCGTLEGLLEEDDVMALAWAAFTDKNVGSNKEVVIVYTLMGEQAGNYEAPDVASSTANITKASVNVIANDRQSYVGNETVPLGYESDDLFDGDSFSGTLETNANIQKVGTYSITQGTLTAGDNYKINFTSGTYKVLKKLTQSIEFMGIENNKLTKTYGDPDFENTVGGACSDVVLKSSNEDVAVIDGMKVRIVGVGTAVITAESDENEIYGAAETKYTLTVKQATVPETGDSNNVVLLIIMIGLAACIIASLLVALRRKV